MPGKPGGSTVWDKSDFLLELAVALFSAAQAGGAMNPGMRDAVIEHLTKMGHTVTWEAIRPFHPPLFPDSSQTCGIVTSIEKTPCLVAKPCGGTLASMRISSSACFST
ncbi:hypothetical protein EDB81DRAFT_411760 [Dactylonectria macrodidyma]|uniref:Uncharacterized protein n=1 Tax=Dactylonectria macrodidyma TaxID=307937 RepID=A0A9P9FAA6_9HYPO|nr:hypothetical protein EDB81DRAFT_411760 [Dactylonectria macrodidyma]